MFPQTLRRNMSVQRHSKSPKQCLTFLAPRTRKSWNLNPILHNVSIWKVPSEGCKAFRDLRNLPATRWSLTKISESYRSLPKIFESVRDNTLPCFYRDKHKLHWRWNHNKPSQRRRLGLRLGRSSNNLTLIMKYFNKIGNLFFFS